GAPILAIDARHGNQNSFFLHLAVGNARLPAEFRSADFEPDEVIRMIDEAHPVGLGVTDADCVIDGALVDSGLVLHRPGDSTAYFAIVQSIFHPARTVPETVPAIFETPIRFR